MHQRKVIALTFFVLAIVAFTAASAAEIIVTAKQYHADQEQADRAKRAAIEQMLNRDCAAKWPLKGTNYEQCKGRVRRMFRRDI